MRLVEFVRKAKKSFGASTSICIGNSGGDLDSVVSSMAYAWLQHERNGVDVTPVVSFPRDELVLRKDVELVLSELGVGIEDLVFTDDLSTTKQYSVHLVDHNEVDGPPTNGKIAGIIDHHADSELYKDAKPRVIEKAGSCVSLVVRELLDATTGLTDEEQRFLTGPLLADTRGLTARVEDVDTWAAEKLCVGDPEDYTARLQAARGDVKGLTPRDLLRKDYKQWDIKRNGGAVKSNAILGISSVVGHVTGVIDAMPAWAMEKKLTTLLAMGSYEDSNGVFCRELAVYGEFPGPAVVAALRLQQRECPVTCTQGVAIYQQHAVECSRKQVAPLVQSLLEIRDEE